MYRFHFHNAPPHNFTDVSANLMVLNSEDGSRKLLWIIYTNSPNCALSHGKCRCLEFIIGLQIDVDYSGTGAVVEYSTSNRPIDLSLHLAVSFWVDKSQTCTGFPPESLRNVVMLLYFEADCLKKTNPASCCISSSESLQSVQEVRVC